MEVVDGLSRELPAWMFDAEVCGRMTLGPPQASIAALTVLCEVLALRQSDPAVDRRSDPSGIEEKSDEAIDEGNEATTGAVVRARRPDSTNRGGARRSDKGSGLDLLLEAMGIKVLANQSGDDDESEDLA